MDLDGSRIEDGGGCLKNDVSTNLMNNIITSCVIVVTKSNLSMISLKSQSLIISTTNYNFN
jgi:hypothetical protein